MNIQEALNILKPTGNNPTDLKQAYRKACKKYHPDINPDSLELMKIINAAYTFLKKHINKWSYSQTTDEQPIDEAIQEIFDKIKFFSGIVSEICGTWLWIGGNTIPYKKQFKAMGFKWAPKKKKWYWKQGTFKKRSKKFMSMDNIRSKYGSVELEHETLNTIDYRLKQL